MNYTIKEFLDKQFAVHVTEAEWPECAKMLEAAGVTWKNDKKPTQFTPFLDRIQIEEYCGEKRLVQGCGSSRPIVPFLTFYADEMRQQFMDGKIGVRCDTRDEYDRLMRECEAKGITWNCGDAPTKWNPFAFGDKPPMKFVVPSGNLCWRSMDQDCFGKPHVSFSTIFPADPWAEFVEGRCYLRVTKDEWPEFAKRCEAAGLRSGYAPNDNDVDLYRLCSKCRAPHRVYNPLDSYHTYNFSTIARPEAEAKKPEYKVGDLFVAQEVYSHYRPGDILRMTCVPDDSGLAGFERVSDGNKKAMFVRRAEPYTPPLAEPEAKIEPTKLTVSRDAHGGATVTVTIDLKPQMFVASHIDAIAGALKRAADALREGKV